MDNKDKKPDFGKGDASGYEEFFKRVNQGKSSEEEKEQVLKFFTDLIEPDDEEIK